MKEMCEGMQQNAIHDFGSDYGRVNWQVAMPPADRSFVDVCVVCALAEEARAFLRVVRRNYDLLWSSEVSRQYGYEYRLATLPNEKGELLSVHLSWPARYGPQEMFLHLDHVVEEYEPRLVAMIGICAGDKRHVHLGDLVVAERVFAYDSAKVAKDEHGRILYQQDMITHQVHRNTLQFLRLFDRWEPRVAALARPLSKQQQRDWLLQRLFVEPTGSVLDIPLAEREKHAPAWQHLVRELQQGPEPFLSSVWKLRDKAMIEQLYFREIPFPFRDPPEAACHICPLASGGTVRRDDPFAEIRHLLRGAVAIDMEGAAFGGVMEMERFRGIEWLIVKGVSDYADADKDDLYRAYAAEVSATYMLCFIEAYVTQERLPGSRYDGTGAKHLGLLLQAVTSDPFSLHDAIAVLGDYSQIGRDVTAKTLNMQRLVQVILQDAMDEATQQEWVQRAVSAVREAFPAVEFATWQQYERYLPHALVCAELTEQGKPMLLEVASLHNRIGSYLYERGWYSEAEPWYMRALAIREEHLGLEHPTTAISLNNLAVLYRAQGKYEQAESLFRRVLLILVQQLELGSEHPHTAVSLNNLAVLYDAQGKYEQTERLYQRALSIKEQQLGPEHPHTAISLNDLAVFYDAQGKYEQAEQLHIRAQLIREQQLGSEHPSTAQSLNNLALLYHHQEKYEQAEQLYVQALAIREQQLGPQHPHTAQSLNNLAALYYGQGKYSQAEPLYDRALSICEQQLGVSHPETALSLNNLAALYYVQGKYAQAEPLYWRALSICEQQLGLEHPDTAQSLNNLAVLCAAQGKYEQAECLYLRALAIWECTLGPEHPHTRTVRANLQGMGREGGG